MPYLLGGVVIFAVYAYFRLPVWLCRYSVTVLRKDVRFFREDLGLAAVPSVESARHELGLAVAALAKGDYSQVDDHVYVARKQLTSAYELYSAGFYRDRPSDGGASK